MTLEPITRIILQHATGYYSVTFDGTAAIVVLPGAGCGVVAHNGVLHSFTAADPSAKVNTGLDYAEISADMLAPIQVVGPSDDLSKLGDAKGLIELRPGDYTLHVS